MNPFQGAFYLRLGGFFAVLLNPFIFHLFGRKTILLSGFVASFLTYTLAATFILLEQYYAFYWTTIAYVFVFQFTISSLTWIYPAEVLEEKGKGLALSLFFLTCIVANLLVPYIMSSLSIEVTFYMYAFFNSLGLLYSVIFLRETKGL